MKTEVKLLANGNQHVEQIYKDFLNDKVEIENDYFTSESVYLDETPDFPIYMGDGSEEEKVADFMQAFKIVSESYLGIDNEITFNQQFWRAYLILYKREYILEKYPKVKHSLNNFKNVVFKKFDWENYIYKTLIGAQIVSDNFESKEDREKYFHLILSNLDVFNYMIKYAVFRNDQFIINVLDIIDELNLSTLLKAKIKDRPDLGNDPRYGRQVMFEFNKSYPVIMSPMMNKEDLQELFLQYLSYYYDLDKLEAVQVLG